MTHWRRTLHTHPELGFQEYKTAAFVAEKLRDWGIETHTGIGGTGVVGVIEGNQGAGGRLGLRADMDALPMQEDTGADYRSATPGVFHGCGHDGHTTILLGTAYALSRNPAFQGTVNLVFQPAEETLLGGLAMMDDGLFERFPCDEIYGLHNHPPMPSGQVGVRVGALLSACDLFRISIKGVGGHAASPHRARDPIVIGSALVSAIQTITSRSIDPLQTAVVSVCQFNAGTAPNIIASTATLEGTVRTLDRQVQADVLRRLREVCVGVGATYDCEIEFDHLQTSPPTLNKAGPVQTVIAAAREVVGEANLDPDVPPLMASEDFAYMLERVPGAYFFLGNGGAMCHNPKFDFNDASLPVGVRMFVEIVRQKMAAR
ncbi:MAG: amidohydrolase [Burkholderiaceae bacterium]|nr:amidohydrolase [Burkholderiaceae bacterium]